MSATRRINEIVRRKLLGRVLYEQGQSVVTLRDVTFGITSFERPIHLRALLESIRRYYPEANILVADCSHAAPPVPYDAELIRLPFDVGLSEMRNALIRRLRTKYFLLLEEDFVFTAETRIEPLIDVLESDATVGSVGGSMRLVGKPGIQDYAVDHDAFGKQIFGIEAKRPLQFAALGTPYRHVHKHLNFGLWRRDMLLEHSWAGLPKLGEHTPYFIRVGDAGRWRVAHTRSSIVLHDTSRRPAHYQRFRYRAGDMMVNWMRANGGRSYSQEFTIGRPATAEDRPCVVLLGIGHSGTTVAAKMLFKAGWQAADADDEFGESVSVRDLNMPVRFEFKYDPNWRLDTKAAAAVLAALPRPWAIKDPRFAYSLEQWLPALATYQPSLVWLRKDNEAVIASHVTRGELSAEQASDLVLDARERCVRLYETWPWAKVAIDFEQLGSMAALFDRSKIKSGCDVPTAVPDWQI